MGKTIKHGLGRLPSTPDPRDYLMSAAVRELEKRPRPQRQWFSKLVLDQGLEPECVGFAWAGWGISAPVEDPWGNAEGHFIYKACKRIDGDVREGSTVRAGAKVMLARKRIATYFWASSADEALDYVARFGPVVFGTIFTEGMCNPSFIGSIIRPTGKIVGGHAYDVVGVDAKYATIKQSWGIDHGNKGYVRISLPNLRSVFRADGEACAATETPLKI